jgi:hypothetical protein
MSQEITATLARITNTGRSGCSPKLLQRKAREKAVLPVGDAALEDDFPIPQAQEQARAQELESGSCGAATAPVAPAPAAPLLWSIEDEAGLQALLARRKAAGYQRRGQDVSAQRLRTGSIKPNPGTIVSAIVGLFACREQLSRAELLDLIAATEFPHRKAQPQDRGWCQGYVAGAIRGGFLTVVAECSAPECEASAAVSESSTTAGGA